MMPLLKVLQLRLRGWKFYANTRLLIKVFHVLPVTVNKTLVYIIVFLYFGLFCKYINVKYCMNIALYCISYEGRPKSFRPRHIRQQYFPQFVHQLYSCLNGLQ